MHVQAGLLLSLLVLPLTSLSAEAYIGPGASAGTIAVVVGILASIVMAFFAILWYPAKRFLKKRRKLREETKIPPQHTSES